MAEGKSEVLLKLKVDTSQVKREVSKATQVEAKAKQQATSKTSKGGDGATGSSSAKSGTSWKGALKAGGAGLAIGAMIAKFSDNIMSRQYDTNRKIMSSQSLSNSGLITSDQHSKNIMTANIDNIMGKWSNISMVQERVKQKIMGSQEYRDYQRISGLESEVMEAGRSGAMGAYQAARSQGVTLSEGEMKKIADIEMELSREFQGQRQKINQYLSTQESAESQNSYLALKRVVDTQEGFAPLRETIEEALGWWVDAIRKMANMVGGGGAN